jgi:hypothetical protein
MVSVTNIGAIASKYQEGVECILQDFLDTKINNTMILPKTLKICNHPIELVLINI